VVSASRACHFEDALEPIDLLSIVMNVGDEDMPQHVASAHSRSILYASNPGPTDTDDSPQNALTCRGQYVCDTGEVLQAEIWRTAGADACLLIGLRARMSKVRQMVRPGASGV
jgi:hypothetical protein